MRISAVSILPFFFDAAPVAAKILTVPLVPHSEVVRRRRLRRRHLGENPERVGASVYEGYGTHYIDLWVGSPTPQRQTVIVDTGSGVTAFPCKGCADCGADHHVGDYFDNEKSESFKKLTCNDCFLGDCGSDHCSMSMSYAEGSSWTAFEAKDRMYTGGKHEEPVANATGFELNFGCQTSLTGLFKTQLENGIAGMMNDDKSLWKQLYVRKEIDKQIFSLCYLHNQKIDKEGTPAGAMSLGGTDESIWKTPMVYASSNDKDGGFYGIGAKTLYLWDANDLNPQVGNMTEMMDKITKIGTISTVRKGYSPHVLDSGTTSTYFPSSLLKPFSKVWKEIVGADFVEKGFKTTEENLKKIPTILVQFDGTGNEHLDPDETPNLAGTLDPDNEHDVVIAITPTQYLVYKGKEKGFDARVHFQGNNDYLYGANTMAGHDVAFDVENGRIGFAQSDCTKVNEKS